MPSIDSLIQQVRESGLSQKQKDELVKRIVREGPDFDLLSAIAATEPPSEKKAKILISESKAMSIFAAVLMIPLFLVFYPVASRWIDSFRGEPVAVAPVPKATSAPAPRVDTSPPREDTEGGAYVWAKGFVEERLRSPSTASFPGYGMRISPIWGIALGKLFLTLMLKMLSAQKLESISKRRFNTSEMGNGNSYP